MRELILFMLSFIFRKKIFFKLQHELKLSLFEIQNKLGKHIFHKHV